MNKRLYRWPDGKTLELGKKTLVMGILNVTPDSFSDGGKWNDVDLAIKHMKEMVEAGADIIDIGAESSRPGFSPMSASDEIQRLEKYLKPILEACPVPVSIDTFKSETAEFAAAAGVHILNDIWGLQYSEEPGLMAEVAARYNLPVILMHNQANTEYNGDIIHCMKAFFGDGIKIAIEAGIKRDNIILDPGIGFGKTCEDNLYVMKRLEEIGEIEGCQYPVLLGTSRKSFIGKTLNLPVDERMEATGATCVVGIMKGCDIMRVHDVAPIVKMCRITDAIMGAERHG
ncbi:MAG: dihydropteroate synthase [Anaerovibrio sp.]|uniref:dihydropteroate synthase n=1 Tax=Anaerovibrio sp. TaxID=1872532 RepID=UPI0025E0668A|nr:dihydropteroate synthase [Anaerovibrio sp.]MCR5176328.1 dihydropteroate synthase [Anaerovibrio sp.]